MPVTIGSTTTASQWLVDNPGDFLALEEMLQATGMDISIFTELPDSMKKVIAEQLQSSFSKPYWASISQTTMGNAELFLVQGLEEGWSIRRIAEEMASSFQGSTYKYAKMRATRIARTECGHALNGARRASMDEVADSINLRFGERVVSPTWLSVLGTTTRDSHASLDGVPADKDGMWLLAGVRVPWPGHDSLPAEERINCQCSIIHKYGLRDDEARQLIEDYFGREESRLEAKRFEKHLQDRHNQLDHGRGSGGLGKVLETVKKHTGFSEETIKDALTGDCSSKNPERARIRAKIIGSIYASGTAKENVINDVLDADSSSAKAKLISGMTSGSGGSAIPVKEMGGLPEFDLKILGGIHHSSSAIPGEAVCNMGSRTIEGGKGTRSGSWRHEVGHAVRSSLGGDSYKTKRLVTREIAKEYDKVMERVKENPAGAKKKMSHDWYEDNYGVAGSRSIDNFEENFAEHYRLYHREVHRDRNEGGGGKHLAKYRKRHPGMSKIFDAYYTAARLGQAM